MTNTERMHKATTRAYKSWSNHYAAESAWDKAKDKMTDDEWTQYCKDTGSCETHKFFDLG